MRHPARTSLAERKASGKRRRPVDQDPDEKIGPDPKDVIVGGGIAFLLGLLGAAGEQVGRRLFGSEEEPEAEKEE